MPAPEKQDNDDILPWELPDEIDDSSLESLLHPTFDECDDDSLLELDDEYWEALLLDDDYEVQPERGDFWIDRDAA
jgi:hypothetical protein